MSLPSATTSLSSATILRARRARPGVLVAGTLAVSAWIGLWLWDSSAYGRYLHHDGLVASGWPAPLGITVFVAGWVLMLVAMMLPSTEPLLSRFGRLVHARPDRAKLVAALVIGYLLVWTVAGLVAYLGDVAVHGLEERVGALHDRPWLLGAGALAAAGAYQLSNLKERCLTACRSPQSFIMRHWHGRNAVAEALTIGADHGRSCVGCCWALMLVMFAIGAGSLAWMLGLAAVMTAEKTLPRGEALTIPLAVLLLGTAAGITALNVL